MNRLIATLLERINQRDVPILHGDTTEHTGPSLVEAVRQRMTQLQSLGITQGDVVAMEEVRKTVFLETLLGAWALGAIVMPLNPRATFSERRGLLEDARPALLLTDRADAELPFPYRSWTDVAEIRCPTNPSFPPASQQPLSALLCYTSGTTGRPKGVLLTDQNLQSTLSALHERWGWSEHDRLLLTLPLFHIHGLVVAQLGALWAGAYTRWLDAFEPNAVWRHLSEDNISIFMGVPTYYQRLLQASGSCRTLRLWTSGSAPLPPTVHARFAERTGSEIVERYGMTETGILFATPAGGPIKVGSVGPALQGVDCKIQALDTAETVATGEVGQVLVRGPSVFHGYLGRPDATQTALAGGWMHTGDLGCLDPDGYLFLKGRHKDMAIVGGFNVYPSEVENLLRNHPEVNDAAVLAIPDRDLGERLVGHIRSQEPVDMQALLTYCRTHLSAYKVPRAFVAADDFPRNPMGKVQKHKLAEQWRVPSIRHGTRKDTDRLTHWSMEMALETEDERLDPETVRKGITATFSADHAAQTWVIELAGHPIGQFIITYEWSDWRGRWVWWLQSVYLEPLWRGRGLFDEVYRRLRDRAQADGAAGLRLYVDKSNTRAIRVYKRLNMDDQHYTLFEDLF